MLNNDVIINYLVNYGLAGIAIYVFYKLIYIFYRLTSNELKELRESIERLNENINFLVKILMEKVKS
jgi:Na+/melibiose symporter-like transporter